MKRPRPSVELVLWIGLGLFLLAYSYLILNGAAPP